MFWNRHGETLPSIPLPNPGLCVLMLHYSRQDILQHTTYSDFPFLFEKTTAGGYSMPLLGRDGNYYKPRFDTNWEDLTFPPSNSTNHNISVRGGSENAKFGVFLGYTLDDGLLLEFMLQSLFR